MADLQYTTTFGERWDNVAFKHYGDASLSAGIISANPDVPITDVLPAGTLLNIPVLQNTEPATDPELLPPWKR